MIMTKKEYKILKDSGDPAWETIEALREVVNKLDEWFDPALWILGEGNICFWCHRWEKDGHKKSCIRNNLPSWILEDE